MNQVNLKRLAQELNLSIATVSRALQDSYEVSSQTKERVKALAAELNYEPNAYASSLRRNISKTIGVVVPEVNNHFFSLVINGIEEVAHQSGYHVLIYLTHDDYEREVAITQYLTGGRVDGLLMSVASESQKFAHLQKLYVSKPAIVFFDRVCEAIATANVTTNDYESGYLATRHLIEAGCRHIAYLLVSGNLSIGRIRMQGYQAALRDHGLPYDDTLVVSDDGDDERNTARIMDLLRRRPEVDGIFASVEHLAISSYHACHALGRAIPAEVKIIGFSNLGVAALLAPALTTITQPAYEMGKAAAQILLCAIEKKRAISPGQSLVLKSELFARRSTAS
ncbi:transcriptional regulator, LacI family [Hymenobacter roseosalivarius DSM 11622]|uniref:Transcriptional regulator, LacI family n=1 Tax=Hymenobacter roseosalivarius DSM 11622 TaxID=645990 RepID=A0A1W1V1B2_9BACT|nr:LacI family DNA-binding transcriptional regulator [Hymenobacter roseosalivarius]SMB87092.1 transcriptional regulator, LacI family [Hymenobacter roseosalivarius DSM 11622]